MKIKIQIFHWITGSVLFEYEIENNTIAKTVEEAVRRSADLRYADLRYADLRSADLRYADLRYADLRYADLRYADLSYADLSYANLSYANLRYAKNLPTIYKDNLSILLAQKNKLIAYKYLNSDWGSPIQFSNRIFYKVGETYEEKDCNTNIFQDCGAGLNVATLDWCLRDTDCDLNKIYIEVEFDPKDIVAIPYSTDGKFRVSRLRVVRKLSKKELQKHLKVLNKE